MATDRSKRLFLLRDVRVLSDGLLFGDNQLRPLWKDKNLWGRADAHAFRFGMLLQREGFQLLGFHHVYLTPTTSRFRLQREPFSDYEWWFREVAVPMDVAEWKRASRDASGRKIDREIADWMERGLRFIAKRLRRDPSPVKRVAQRLQDSGEDTLVPLQERKNRHGTASAFLKVAPSGKKSELIVRVSLATEPDIVREVRLKLSLYDDAMFLCRGVKFDGKQVELTRTKSVATRAWTKGYPRKLRFAVAKMKIAPKS